jgi:hypothetical protein
VIGITTSPNTWDTAWYSRIHETIPASWGSSGSIFHNYHTHHAFTITTPGTYTYYLIGEMDEGRDADDDFWWAHMSAIYFPEPIVTGREQEEIAPEKLEG